MTFTVQTFQNGHFEISDGVTQDVVGESNKQSMSNVVICRWYVTTKQCVITPFIPLLFLFTRKYVFGFVSIRAVNIIVVSHRIMKEDSL